MKPLIHTLTVLALVISFSTCQAQKALKLEYQIEDIDGVHSGEPFYEGWFHPIEGVKVVLDIYKEGPVIDSIGLLYPDSLPVIAHSDSSRSHADIHSVGAVFDASAEYFELVNDGIRQTRYQLINIDSIAFPYAYNRPQDSVEIDGVQVEVVDTLEVHLFKRWHLQLDMIQMGDLEAYIARPEMFSKDTLGYEKATCASKILLRGNVATSSSDSSVGELKLFKITVPPSVGHKLPGPFYNLSNLFGFSITFKPMIRAKDGDTLMSLLNSNVHTRNNYFAYSLFVNHGEHLKSRYFVHSRNTSFFTHTEQRYGDKYLGWSDNTPGQAYKNGRYFNSSFHVTFQSASIEKVNSEKVAIQVFPNPSALNITVRSAQPNRAIRQLRIYNLHGAMVKQALSKANQAQVDVDVSDLPDGIYHIQAEVGTHFYQQNFVKVSTLK